ncbi:hypothetical protein Nepgr_021191 [Nepenthes gracilis]|uniref:Proteasome subunit alpha type n=1 Tax=Nepenthes gracilis TaxID=150966 RepID=A0AAD3XX02_NEPGR|nr:hypothetical protein Nepgr_021191 [Nepenthes gracilis]
MFRNQYDTDVTTWSPAGRLFQVEYAMEARKIFKVDDHIGVAIAGLTADGRVLFGYMRSECINFRFTYESLLHVGRLVVQLADKAQITSYIQAYQTLEKGVKDEIFCFSHFMD